MKDINNLTFVKVIWYYINSMKNTRKIRITKAMVKAITDYPIKDGGELHAFMSKNVGHVVEVPITTYKRMQRFVPSVGKAEKPLQSLQKKSKPALKGKNDYAELAHLRQLVHEMHHALIDVFNIVDKYSGSL